MKINETNNTSNIPVVIITPELSNNEIKSVPKKNYFLNSSPNKKEKTLLGQNQKEFGRRGSLQNSLIYVSSPKDSIEIGNFIF